KNVRLKGVEITKVRHITGSGVGPDITAIKEPWNDANPWKRPNCATWSHPSRCVDGKVAVGVTIHYSDDAATGLQHVCAAAGRVPLSSSRLPIYGLDATKAHVTDPSGFRGTPARVGAPAGDGYALNKVTSWEHSDKPCAVGANYELLREVLVGSGPRDLGRADFDHRCAGRNEGDPVSAEAVPTDDYIARNRDVYYETLVRGVRICMDSDGDRLKGIEVAGISVLAVQSGKIWLEETPLNTAKGRAKDWRTHCHDDRWQ